MIFKQKVHLQDTKAGNDNKEKDLIKRIGSKDGDAMEAIYKLYFDRLFRFAFRISGRLDYIEEIINDIMFVVWNKAETYNQTCRPSTWIFGIAYNIVRKYQKQPTYGVKESDFDTQDPVDSIACSRDWVKQVERQDQLEKAFAVLSEEQRLVVELTFYNGMHYSEIAQIAGCPENTVKTRMFHAQKKLAQVLKR